MTRWTLVKVVGKTLANPDGTVRSWSPAQNTPPFDPYTLVAMPAGTAGPFELCEIDGSRVAYNPTGHDGFVFGFMLTCPNAPGMSLVTVDPL